MYGYGYSPFAKNISSSGGTPIDPDAQEFITAAAITNPTQQSAINTLVTDLKGYGLWTKISGLYPFVGGTASQHKFNLKNPRDTDAAFRLVFNGGVTHSSNGVLFNGTNGWANTFVNPLNALTLNNTHCSLYSRTNNLVAGTDIGTAFNARTIGSVIKWTDNNGYHDMYNNTTNRIIYNMSGINSTGLFINNRTSNVVHNIWRNNTKLSTNSNIQSSTLPDFNISIGALNSNFGAQFYTNRQYAFASIGDGLTDAEAANLYTAVQAFQTTLVRNV